MAEELFGVSALPKPLWETPTLTSFNIGSFTVSTYPLMIFVGALGMLVCIWYRRKRFPLSFCQSVIFTLLLTVCGIAGAKLLYILENLEETLKNGPSLSGVSFFGSVYLIPLAMPLAGRFFRLKTSQTNDLCAPCIAVMIAFIRIGCFMNGCCGGRVAYIGNYYFTWPTQILECIGDFIIFFWLLRLEQHGKWQGLLYPMLMISYSVLRFFVELLRYTPEKFLNISNGHWFTIIAVLAALMWIKVYERRNAAIHEPNNR